MGLKDKKGGGQLENGTYSWITQDLLFRTLFHERGGALLGRYILFHYLSFVIHMLDSLVTKLPIKSHHKKNPTFSKAFFSHSSDYTYKRSTGILSESFHFLIIY